MNSKKCDNAGVSPLKASNGISYSDSTTKANILNDQFSSVFNMNEDATTIKDKGPSPHSAMDPIIIHPDGIHKLLAGLQIHKACGPDEIPTRLLKVLADELTPVISLFFQASLNQGIIPEDWKKANVVPVFKKGDRNRAENYRPISLTSVTCKLLEHVICSSIMRHLDKYNILNDAQHGFRKRRSCATQLIQTIQDLAKSIETRDQVDVILLDFSKAFDRVPHLRLLHKLKFYGIEDSTYAWIADFLNHRSQQVILDGATSRSSPVHSGVPQGSVLGPLLFLLFINDLPDVISPQSTVKLFADDCILYRKIQKEEDAAGLQHDLDQLQKWEKDWLMEFHPQKCQVLHVTNKKKIFKIPYNIHGHTLEEADSAKYLGVNIHHNLTWNPHIQKVASKANSTRAFLQRNIHQCPRETKVLCYKTLLRPVMEYAGVVWDSHSTTYIRKLEMVQRRYARFVFHDYRTTSSVSAMLYQLQWPTLQERRAQAKVEMMYRIAYGLVDIPQSYLVPTVMLRGHSMKYHVPFARTTVYQHSFFPDGIRLWNALPQQLVDSTSLECFRGQVQSVQLR